MEPTAQTLRQVEQMNRDAAAFGEPAGDAWPQGTFVQQKRTIEHLAKAARLACCEHEEEITGIVDGSSAAGGNFRKQVTALQAVAAKGTAMARGGGKKKRKTRKLSKKRRPSKKRRRTKRR